MMRMRIGLLTLLFAAAPVTVTAQSNVQVPQAFQGRWEEAAQFCQQPSDATLTIESDALRGWEATGNITQIETVGPREILITASYSGEGESWESTARYQLSGDGQTLITSTDTYSFKRMRCPEG
ncbi:hypothetical protein D6851_13400 [Altericroceibacterium spongiae]|uniref:C-type lysozyme inhibitor domain-containing protein n=1 Tax=Altericroceibacterium spongiae TaxID=2320269 RepID=A0A420EEA6_9SPHN|nr:hypothetical protein [Altericroceibacterium spongiae]RKF19015.1 hypothetical protein D6851_13400 [Altericroceibacterium spongiae]